MSGRKRFINFITRNNQTRARFDIATIIKKILVSIIAVDINLKLNYDCYSKQEGEKLKITIEWSVLGKKGSITPLHRRSQTARNNI